MKMLTEITTPFAELAKQPVMGAELDWLQSLRNQASQLFERQGLPAKKVEDWKYTSLWELSQQSFQHHVAPASVTAEQVSDYALFNNGLRLVFVDGQFAAELSVLDSLPAGVTLGRLNDQLDAAKPFINQQIDLEKAGLNALNTMLMHDGVFLHVAANTEVTTPIEILVINSGKTAQLASHLRHVISLEAGAKATIAEQYVDLADNAGFNNMVSEVSLAEKACLQHYKLQRQSLNSFHIATMAATQRQDSQWHTYNIALGAKLARNDIHSRLVGEQSHVTMDGLYLVSGDQHTDTHTRIDHSVPNTTSEEVYKGVLDGNSHAVFNGKVIVHKDAQKTDANQSNRNLLLSRGCEIDSKPEMEIYADDVKCGHGSTVGQLDEQQLFFLRARGLDETSARSLLTYAFAVEVLQRIPSEPVRQTLSALIEKHLPKGSQA
jgi:Fe-S cluster assembly protein SufD